MLRTVSDIHVILHYFPCNINSFKWKSGKIGMKKEGEVENVLNWFMAHDILALVNYCIEILKTTDNKTVLFQLLYQLLKIL